MFNKAISFVDVKPADHILDKIFDKTDIDFDGYISVSEYTQMIDKIFGGY